jgi:hypothetical protein
MATNGILDITTEEYMGQDPEMQIDQDEMIEIIRTLQVIGIPQDKHPEVLEAFKEWKQTNAGTVDMFLEASLQLEPGTITKIKEQQVARGPEDVLTEEDMTIQPGSPDMQEIMQSVGAPQRAAQGGIMGYQGGEEGDIGIGGQPLVEYKHEGAENPQSWWERTLTGTHDAGVPHLPDMEKIIDFLKKMGSEITQENVAKAARIISKAVQLGPMGIGSLGSLGAPEEIEETETEEMFQKGGRAGYANGDVILPQPKPRYWERGDGSMKAMMGVNQNDPRYQAMGMNLDAGAPEIYPQPKPAVPFIAQQQMQPFTGGVASVMPAGLSPYSGQGETFGQINNMGLQGMEDIDMRVVMDFLMKMGMEPTPENIEKAVEALGAAAKYGQAVEDVNVDVDETIDMGYQHGGRAGYGLGSFVKSIFKAPKKIFKSVKKIAKSPLGKAAMMYLATAGMANVGAGGKWSTMDWMKPGQAFGIGQEGYGNLGTSLARLTNKVLPKKALEQSSSWVPGAGKMEADIAAIGSKKIEDMSALEARKWKQYVDGLDKVKDVATPWYKSPWFTIPAASIGAGLYTQANPGDTDLGALSEGRDEEVAEWDKWLEQIGQNPSQYNFGRETTLPFPNYAEGGRIGAQEGGIMDLGGMEKDFRNTGGFVDIGAKEKADDVPARLSVNEFVMTADAVRGAGDGDVEEGAERLQDTMKQLEQKGKRHKAAQGMFATSQRLGEVI